MSSVELLSDSKAAEQIESLFGEENVAWTANTINRGIEIIKTPSPSLDRALGIGGWPRGRLIQLAGKESSGKTLLALLTIAHWQSLDPENCAAFIDAEFTYDHKWAAKLGVDNNRVMLIKTNEAAKIITGLVGTNKENSVKKIIKVAGLLDMIEAGQTITSVNEETKKKIKLNLKKMGVIVLDSIANMLTPTDITSDAGKMNMALMARFLSNELKKLTEPLAKSNVVMLAINQVRVEPGKMYGDPTTTPGGKALKHACSVMIELAPLTAKDTVIFDANEEKIGNKVKAKISKNKVGPAFRNCEYTIITSKGVIKKAEEILETGKNIGAFEKPNARSYIINGEKLSSKEEAIKYIEDNYELVENLLREFYLSGKDELDEVVVSEEVSVDDPFGDIDSQLDEKEEVVV